MHLESASLTVGLALAVGMLAQILARHLRVPGIVLLLAAGVLLGPEVAGVLHPKTLGDGMRILVGFAVAVILFEGGLILDIRRLRKEAKGIRRIVTIGSLITATGGTLAAKVFMGWAWPVSLLFGTLVIVTGPTVVTPLLRRINVNRRVATVLEAEGVFGDAIGAILAVVTLQVIVEPQMGVLTGVGTALATLGIGTVVGAIGGFIIAGLLRVERLIPEGLESVTTLCLVLGIFQLSDALMHESGIAAAIAAGLVVGNVKSHVSEELKEFKEQLTVMFIGLLFVLLAADVRLMTVFELGWPGIAVVLALMVIVRPLNIAASTAGTEFTLKEKAFMAWLAPRGIVAAAVASLFAQKLEAEGIEGGASLQALVFLVIAATVVLQGLSGGLIAKALGITRPRDMGYVLLSAGPLARSIGRILQDGGEPIVLIDTNADECHAAEEAGLRVFFGSGLKESVQLRAEISTRRGVISLTPSDSTNVLFVDAARKAHKIGNAWASLHPRGRVTTAMLHEVGGNLFGGDEFDVSRWNTLLSRGTAKVEAWQALKPGKAKTDPTPRPINVLLLACGKANGRMRPVDRDDQPKVGETVWVLIADDDRTRSEAWLAEQAYTPKDAKSAAE
ncbi:MAG: NhaP-type Na+/H+ or K+/H+ antiporter [Bradymonadia bacterium]|jgi:NhaP-type Na+/H+ or K+/H+ antiporter